MILLGISENSDKNIVFNKTLSIYRELFKMPIKVAKLSHFENGKPYVKGQGEVKLSVSHSGKYLVIALSNNEVGVDIQEEKPVDYQKISARYGFSANDLTEFYKKFTIAEATVKLTSTDLPTSLKQADTLSGTTYHFIKGYTLSVVGEGSCYFVII
ncbi:MAG: hypothetical protein IKA77_03070 [Clostridia bacterium]|nr:hypothetical protein [Clostridia bacterium]